MLYERTAAGTVDAVCDRLAQATAEHKFGVLGVHDLKQKMRDKGVPFERECRILEVCNPQQAKTVLESNMAISTALPCRISVYQEGDVIKVATLKPTVVLNLYGTKELESVAQDVEDTIRRIIDDACG